MTEETAAAFRRDGEPAFPTEGTADETAAASQAEGENKDEGTLPAEGDTNTQTKKEDAPFHEHPRWLERESEWNKRFNEQETRHQDDLKTIREEFGQQRRDNAQQTKIPAWFGGTQDQWDAYRTDRDAELRAIEDRAIARAEKNLETKAGEGQKAVEDATAYMNTEVAAIEADKNLNPTGAKIDRQALLKTVLDENLVDTKGRWNYRAGFKIMGGGAKAPEQKKPDTTEKKEVAAATSSEKGGETKSPTYATSTTFKKDRPW